MLGTVQFTMEPEREFGPLVIVHLTTSPFFGGPERLMLGLTQSLPSSCRSVFALFADHGRSQALQRRLLDHGLEAITFVHDTPHLRSMVAR